mgnify:CR=1 FL=1|jgi:hypothetical protein
MGPSIVLTTGWPVVLLHSVVDVTSVLAKSDCLPAVPTPSVAWPTWT